jgi:sulfur relay (sulfurtransferase) complex TusBCD TusD component (DsrE family)
MAKYFLIESRSPFDSPEVNYNYQLASDLANNGNEVSLFLVENGVFVTRKTTTIESLDKLNNVTLLADDFSLRERGIAAEEMRNNIKIAEISTVAEAMANGAKTVWL